jgi:hypothetical protein
MTKEELLNKARIDIDFDFKILEYKEKVKNGYFLFNIPKEYRTEELCKITFESII